MKLVLLAISLGGSLCAQSFSYLPEPPSTKLPANPPEPKLAKIEESIEMQALIQAAAEKHQVPAAFVRSIVAAESNFNQDAVSRTGAIGLMQLMPQTAKELGADPKIAAENIDAGTRYLRTLIEKYQGSKNWMSRVIAAYNAGPGAVDRYKGVPPYRETRTYVARVLGFLKQFQSEPSAAVMLNAGR